MSRRNAILYITYDGLTDPLGYSQVFRYLANLNSPAQLIVLSFEKKSLSDYEAISKSVRERFNEKGILWVPLTYHKKPTLPATLFDVLHGYIRILFLFPKYKIRVVHARSYVASLIALFPKALGAKFIFDMRGFWADEKNETSGKLWEKNSWLYRLVKSLEKVFLKESDKIISLSLAAKTPIKSWVPEVDIESKFEVIPTCADLEKFKLQMRSFDPNATFTLGYVGAVGLWYDFDSAVNLFKELRVSRASPTKFLIVNKGEHALILNRLSSLGIEKEAFELVSATPDEMPDLLKKMNAVCFFIKKSFSKTASAPTKLGELLASGIPCITNGGVGDTAQLLSEGKVGVVVNDFSVASLKEGAKNLQSLLITPDLSKRCRQVAEKHFSLEKALERYEVIYKSFLISV